MLPKKSMAPSSPLPHRNQASCCRTSCLVTHPFSMTPTLPLRLCVLDPPLILLQSQAYGKPSQPQWPGTAAHQQPVTDSPRPSRPQRPSEIAKAKHQKPPVAPNKNSSRNASVVRCVKCLRVVMVSTPALARVLWPAQGLFWALALPLSPMPHQPSLEATRHPFLKDSPTVQMRPFRRGGGVSSALEGCLNEEIPHLRDHPTPSPPPSKLLLWFVLEPVVRQPC